MTTDSGHPDGAADRYRGFHLRDVTWGYRDSFERIIEELFAEGRLGRGRRDVTGAFFDLLKRADRSCYDDVLRQFLNALAPANRWIMDLPGLFADLAELGGSLADSRLNYGRRFFETFAAGGMGDSPQALRACLQGVRRLRTVDEDLAMAFLAGYRWMTERLQPADVDRYVEAALQIHQRSRDNGYRFLRGELNSSDACVRSITQECRLSDVAEPLAAMITALAGRPCEVEPLDRLDSDHRIERGTAALTVEGRVWLPVRVRRFDTAAANRRWYTLCGIASAAMLLDGTFARIHGHADYPTCAALAGNDGGRINLFQVLEFTRVLRGIRRRWPGAARLAAWGLRTALGEPAGPGGPEGLLADALDQTRGGPVLEALRRAADACGSCFDVAGCLDEPWAREVLAAWPHLADRSLRTPGFLSDFMFPMELSRPPSDQAVADLKDAQRRRGGSGAGRPARALGADADEAGEKAEAAGDAAPAAFLYDEWDVQQGAYRPQWCQVRPRRVEPAAVSGPRRDWTAEARQVRALFERIRPDAARRRRRLADGDDITIDLLLEHLVARRREPSPPARFYEKPVIARRDLAVLILLDTSGSTGAPLDGRRNVLDVEKQAAIILAEALATLGDPFAVCGFNSDGREQCEYLLFKDFDDPWPDAAARILAVRPRRSTRIGAALRHSGRLLAQRPQRRRLILLVTDGKPMDRGYDPATRYAQHDVRMACEENLRRDIHTFAISTEANSVADMEIMFPRRRFVILPSISRLPAVLPQVYLRLTV
ncbi:MAG: VWA domain-containing protein [Planctomycetes bacterium]|nr:VWA domain-containing protein [Planctomycetota bacterium]